MAVTREARARAEIARRRDLAQEAINPSRSWRQDFCDVDSYSRFVTANDPAHILKVLDAHLAILDRHTPIYVETASNDVVQCECAQTWPCPDTRAVLDLYAPEGTP